MKYSGCSLKIGVTAVACSISHQSKNPAFAPSTALSTSWKSSGCASFFTSQSPISSAHVVSKLFSLFASFPFHAASTQNSSNFAPFFLYRLILFTISSDVKLPHKRVDNKPGCSLALIVGE